MGNYKFKLTDMIPNAWLYKLKDMRHKGRRNRSTKHSKRRSMQSSPRANKIIPSRASYYIPSRTDAEVWYAPSPNGARCLTSDAQLILDTPGSSERRSRIKPITKASAATLAGGGCGCTSWKTEHVPEFVLRAYPESPSCQRDYYIEGEALPELHSSSGSSPWSCKITPSPTDIIIDVRTKKSPEKLNNATMPESEIELRSILTKLSKKETKPVKFQDKDVDTKAKRRMQGRMSSSLSLAAPSRLRMRANSPLLENKKAIHSPRRGRKIPAYPLPPPAVAMQHRKSGLSESIAVVKSSSDPQRDFRESILEMIMEHDMRTSKDLEDLLACYLLLNSRAYHDMIVKTFQQIWFDLTDVKL